MLPYMGKRGGPFHALIALLAILAVRPAAADIVAFYNASWAGLPAAEIRLELHRASDGYDDRIAIESRGLSYLLSHFRAVAQTVGQVAPDGAADPQRYDTTYDLRKRRGSRISMHFAIDGGAVIAQRGAGDTSHKPLLPARFRRDVADPLSAFERIRRALRHDRPFAVAVYDGARRFDVVGRVLSRQGGVLRAALSLRPIAGFKGESSDDGDPENAPRPVALSFSDDERMLLLELTVPVWHLPLVVRLDQVCPAAAGAVTTTGAGDARPSCRR